MSDRGGLGGAEQTTVRMVPIGREESDGDVDPDVDDVDDDVVPPEGYWLDAGGRWRSGQPPADWRRDERGRWHPTQVPAAVRVPEHQAAEPPRPVPPPADWLPPIEAPQAAATGPVRVMKRARRTPGRG